MATATSIHSREEVRFRIRGKEHQVRVGETYTPTTTLNDYLRDTLNLTGTKKMCREGGCGVCIVAVTREHPVTKETVTFTVNSCLVSLFTVEDWDITTIEDIATENPDQPDVPSYHKVQDALVQFSGTQCGYCSSGMVMSMYALLEENENVTMSTVENSLGGNICRCTGYRPILAAFKSLASDADRTLIGTYPDIEDVATCKKDGKCKKECRSSCRKREKVSFRLPYADGEWYKVYTIAEIVELFQTYPDSTYILTAGNTTQGVYTNPPDKELYIDITSVEELLTSTLDGDTLTLGANMPLTEVMQLFYEIGASNESFSYLTRMADHIDLVATVPIRNIGSLAGNLSIKHEYHEFPSDIFLIMETVGATITIVDTDLTETRMSPADYIDADMNHKIITKITLNALDDTYKYKSYKIMPRAQNAHALVNAGFLLQLDSDNLVVSARIVYGCINSTFIHATNTENYLQGKSIFDNAVLQEAMATLDSELDPNHILPDPSPEFRKKMAISLFFKYVLFIADPDTIDSRNISGGQTLTRPLSNGTQDYETQESLYPLTQPIPKVEAYAQVSGRAEYIMDMPDRPGQLYGALVLAKAKPYSVIASIDAAAALELSGVVAFYSASDIPGVNSFVAYFPTSEEVFCSDTVKYYNQPVGIVVAEDQLTAEKGAELVNITYTASETQPLFTVRQVLQAGDQTRLTIGNVVNPERTGTDVQHVITGSYYSGMQYHYHMETQCCSVVPVEDGLDVFPATQWMDLIQSAIAENLNMDTNKINVRVRRLGGGYGGKISRNGLVSCAAALASYKLQKPVKIWLPFTTNMDAVGKRAPVTADYEMGLNDEGIVQYLTITLYIDYGYGGGSEDMLTLLLELIKNGYVYDTFKITPYAVKTDMHTNTYCRAPGSTEGLGLIETIFEHASYALNIDPLRLRMANIDSEKYPLLIQYCQDMMEWADIDARKAEIETFNQENRWRKKGLAVVPMAYPYELYGNYYCMVSIYHADGSVSISHGGIEMGQGINTKVAQVCAYTFGIPLDKVKVKPSDTLVSPNVLPTGGSVTSESVVFAFLKAAAILNERMAPVRESLTDPTWLEVVQECYNQDINLNASYKFSISEVESYIIYAVLATEVEVDILTGQYILTRVDLLEDTGESMSPLIDIGQVEGAFIMGQGLWTTEEIIVSDEGEVLTNRTWTYKPPGVKDIPVDFRVKFPSNNPNSVGVLYSKATAEPPLCTTCCIPLAIRRAVASARAETGDNVEKWYSMEGPSTVENTFLNSLHDYTQYTL